MKKVYERIVSFSRLIAVESQLACPDLSRRQSPLARTALTLAIVTLIVVAPAAMAQSTGDLGDAADKASNTFAKFKKLAGAVGLFLALVSMVAAGLKMKQRSHEGANSHVKLGHILGLVGAAVILAFGGALLFMTGASAGLGTSGYGQLD